MLKDPFGDWDFDAMFQLFVLFLIGATFVSFAGATSGNWYDPWFQLYDLGKTYSTLIIAFVMIGLLCLYWYESFRRGYY